MSDLRFDGHTWALTCCACASASCKGHYGTAFLAVRLPCQNTGPTRLTVRRFDFVRGFSGEAVREYLEAASSQFTVGEYWDSLNYNGGVPDFNQVRRSHCRSSARSVAVNSMSILILSSNRLLSKSAALDQVTLSHRSSAPGVALGAGYSYAHVCYW